MKVPRAYIDTAIVHMGWEGNAIVADERGGWWIAKIQDQNLYFCTAPGERRWNPSLGVALASRGYFLTEESVRKEVEEACKIYKDHDINDVVFEQIKTEDGLKTLQDLYLE